MKPTNLTRYTFTLGDQVHPYAHLTRYVCDDCGGAIVHRFVWDEATETTVEKVACGRCGHDEIVSEYQYLKQISDGMEVEQGLPPHLKALMKGQTACLSVTEIIDDW